MSSLFSGDPRGDKLISARISNRKITLLLVDREFSLLAVSADSDRVMTTIIDDGMNFSVASSYSCQRPLFKDRLAVKSKQDLPYPNNTR